MDSYNYSMEMVVNFIRRVDVIDRKSAVPGPDAQHGRDGASLQKSFSQKHIFPLPFPSPMQTWSTIK